jgi:CBS domain-containing protein
METVRQILNHKGVEVLAISPEQSVYEAIKKMAEHEVGALVVLEDDKLVGIISERDYARKIILLGRRSRETLVRDIMVTNPITVGPDDSVRTCMEQMTNQRVRHLPVVEKEKLVGLVSIGDVVRSIMSQQAFMIEQLEHYISGQA